MNNERVREGETIEYTLTDDDVTAETATLTISQNGVILITETANFALVDTVNTATVRATNTLAIGDYDFMFTITYSDGFVAKIPDTADCDSDEPCALPVLTVCDANDVEETS